MLSNKMGLNQAKPGSTKLNQAKPSSIKLNNAQWIKFNQVQDGFDHFSSSKMI